MRDIPVIPVRSILLVFALVQCFVTTALAGEEATIESVFVRYMDAAVNRDGKTVAATMSSDTVQWWTAIIRKSRTAKKQELLSLPLYEAQSILVLRFYLSPQERREWTGRIYFEKSYSNGWNSSQALKRIREAFPDCQKSWNIEAENAYLNLTYKGQPVRGGFRFVKETGVWKIDGVDQARMVEERSQEALKISSLPKEQFMEQMIARVAGGSFPPELWKADEVKE